MSFDPTDLSVKNALEAVADFSDDELDEVYEIELDGKARKTLLDGLTELRESLREAASAASAAVVVADPEPAAASEQAATPAPPAERKIHPWAFVG